LPENSGYVYFSLDGDDFDPDEVTRLLGIEPTSVGRKGSKIPGKIPKFNSWRLSTKNVVDECLDIYDLAKEIADQLEPKTAEIVGAIEQFGLSSRLQVVLEFSVNEEHSTPAIGFYKETVKFIADVGAFIDIDTYKA